MQMPDESNSHAVLTMTSNGSHAIGGVTTGPLLTLPVDINATMYTADALMNGTDAAAAMRMAVTIRWLIRYVAKMPTASLY
jgi:hypothetical protein